MEPALACFPVRCQASVVSLAQRSCTVTDEGLTRVIKGPNYGSMLRCQEQDGTEDTPRKQKTQLGTSVPLLCPLRCFCPSPLKKQATVERRSSGGTGSGACGRKWDSLVTSGGKAAS
ncbi:hypothetical protein WMY93_018755 [Mugilogobius chulae]|uniref:Uncharacterized protein n=1 Tax=Mugilogobius chulae TaxID=88201 RepID=A0AAW0NK84_9GOBI